MILSETADWVSGPASSDLNVTGVRTHSCSTCSVPGDKSISHRALLVAALTEGETILRNVNQGMAVVALNDALAALGYGVRTFRWGTVVVTGSNRPPLEHTGFSLNFGSSSAAARLTMGALAGFSAHGIIDGDASLRARPMDFVVDPLRAMGADIRYLEAEGQLPVELRGGTLHDANVELRVGSAQAISAVLFAGLTAQTRVQARIRVHSRDHTERLFKHLGQALECDGETYTFRGSPLNELPHFSVPGDPSLAAYLAGAHVLHPDDRPLRIIDVCLNPSRLGFFEALKMMGVEVDYEVVGNVLGEPVGAILVNSPRGPLRAITVEGSEFIHSMLDEIPLLAALCTKAAGQSTIRNAQELTFKETNRLETTASMLGDFGAQVGIREDGIVINGGGVLTPSVIRGHNDHRIAMSAVVLATSLFGKSTVLEGACADTSFPGFAEHMRALGFDVRGDATSRWGEDECEP